MKTKALLCAGAVVALAGCAGMQSMFGGGAPARTPIASPLCTATACTYKIAVGSCDKDGIWPEFDPINVAPGSHDLHWVIITPDYTFAQDGIRFPGNPPPFKNATRVTPKQFKWTDDNPGERAKRHKYDIRIVDKDGKSCVWDPTVVNH